jgi:hypothetical protein
MIKRRFRERTIIIGENIKEKPILMEKFGTCMVGLIYGNVVFDFPGLSL